MVNIKAKVPWHQQSGVLLLLLAPHRNQSHLLSHIGERIGNGLTGLKVDGRNNIGAGNVGLAVFPDNVVLIFEPILKLVLTAVTVTVPQ